MIKKVIAHFKKTDLVLFKLVETIGIIELTSSDSYFHNLCRSICSQQLSTKSAAAIFKRFKELFKDGDINPSDLLKMSEEKLRGAGLSRTKITYMKDLASKVMSKEIKFEKFLQMKDEEIILELTKVKGIGVWTVEMFLMSTLGREDIFSYGDLGLRKAIQKLYRLENLPTKLEMEGLVIKWSPYRSYAAKILWKSLEFKV